MYHESLDDLRSSCCSDMTTTVPQVDAAAAPLLRPGIILHAHLFDNVVLTTRILASAAGANLTSSLVAQM